MTRLSRRNKAKIRYRKAHPTLVYGDSEVIDGGSDQLFAYRRWDADGEYFICLNFSAAPYVFLPLPEGYPLSLEIHNYPEYPQGERDPLRPLGSETVTGCQIVLTLRFISLLYSSIISWIYL